jgi:hypothetical protein
VRHLYDEEIAALGEVATVKTFIGLIASRRVKQRLRALRGGGAPKRTSSASTSA